MQISLTFSKKQLVKLMCLFIVWQWTMRTLHCRHFSFNSHRFRFINLLTFLFQKKTYSFLLNCFVCNIYVCRLDKGHICQLLIIIRSVCILIRCIIKNKLYFSDYTFNVSNKIKQKKNWINYNDYKIHIVKIFY